MKRLQLVCVAAITVMASGCSQSIRTQPSAMGNVSMADPQGSGSSDSSNPEVKGFNAEAETAASEECLKAWRRALAGDKAGCMKILDNLEKRFPHLSTTHLMRGQCYERLGMKQEAIKYYEEAVAEDRSAVSLFKLAELKRTAGDVKGSIATYRSLIKSAPDFAPAKLGLAKALIQTKDPDRAAIKQLVQDVLDKNPTNKNAIALMSTLK